MNEIEEIKGMKSSSAVRQLIIRVSDQLKTGEINSVITTPEEKNRGQVDILLAMPVSVNNEDTAPLPFVTFEALSLFFLRNPII